MHDFRRRFFSYFVIVMAMVMLSISRTDADTDIRSVFNSKCAKCHGLKGKITKRGEKLGAKNFNDINWQKSVTDEDILNVITNGKNKMPSWKGKLNQNEIKELVHYVRVLLPRGLRKKMPKDIQKLHYSK